MKTIEQQQIEKWANIYKDTFVNESFTPADLKELDEMIEFCDKQERKFKNSNVTFQVFGFEGQALRGIWRSLKFACELFKKDGAKKLYWLGNALTQLGDVDAHERPHPTDPRDIR